MAHVHRKSFLILDLVLQLLAMAVAAPAAFVTAPSGRLLTQDSCGSLGAACCAGDGDGAQCPAGYGLQADQTLACKGQTCVACGGPSEVCCQQFTGSDPVCGDGSTCVADTCKQCGQEGQACCPPPETGESRFADPLCGEGFTCVGAEQGAAGDCVRCGDVGQDCCDSDARDPCSEGGVCSEGECVECGGRGQPCCRDTTERNDLWRMCGRVGHAMCADGVCTACGRPGEPCCTGDEYGRISGESVAPEDSVCWSGATCPDSRLCPADPIPDASAAERRLCSEDFAEATLGEEGTFFEACVKAAANTECKDTVLAVDGGSRIVPDWCIDYSSNRTVATFSCPGQVDAAPKYVYCAESIRTAKCGNEFCQGGPTACGAWSPRSADLSAVYTIRPGTAADPYPSTPAVYMPAITCDGSLQILTRPGFGDGFYAVFFRSVLQTVPLCASTCFSVPVDFAPSFGTTVAWAATAGTPTDTPGAVSKASATYAAVERDGVHCVGPGISYFGNRTQLEVTCLLLDSPDDVPTGPLFPDAPSS